MLKVLDNFRHNSVHSVMLYIKLVEKVVFFFYDFY